MDQGQHLIETALALLWHAAGTLLGAVAPVETWLRAAMARLGVPPDLQSAVLVVGAVVLGLSLLRALGGLLRIALVLVLLVLAVQALGSAGRPAPHVRQVHAAGTPLVVEYSKCSAMSGCTIGWMACAAIAASLNPCRISLSLPG